MKIAFYTLIVLCLVGCQSTEQPKKIDSTSVIVSENDDREYATLHLDNGLDVILVSDPGSDKSAASLSVGVGMLSDPSTQAGMAHYLEHMLFLGTEKYPDTTEYSEFMSNNGGGSNAYTWLDITNYMFQINNDAYDEALDRFSDFFKSPKLYAEYAEKEKNAVNAEWSMRREMDFFGQYSLARKLFGEHRSNRFLIGNLETLADNDGTKLHDQTVKFYDEHYSANNMKLALLSNQPIAEMKKMALQHFGSIKNKNTTKYRVTDPIPADKRGGKIIYYIPNEDVKQVNLDFTITNNMDEYLYKPNRVLAYLIGSEMPGTPASVLKEKGLISDLNASATPDLYGNYGSFSISINLTEKGMLERESVVATVMQYINLIKQQGVDKKYFTEIQTVLKNQFRFLEKGNSFGYVSNLAGSMQQYPLEDVVAAPFRFVEFNQAAIQKVLNQLTAENLKIWYISKQEQAEQTLHFYDGLYRTEDIDAKLKTAWSKNNTALKLPKVNTLLPTSFEIHETNAQDKPTVAYNKNDIQIWHYPSQLYGEQPKGVFRIHFNSGAIYNDINTQVLQSVWRDLFNINSSELINEAGAAGMNLSLGGENGIELTISGFTDKQRVLLKRGLNSLMVDVDDTAFNSAIDRFVRNTANSEKQFAYSQLFSTLRKVTKNYGVENSLLIKTAKSLSKDDLNKFIQRSLAMNNLRVFAFGNYSTDDINRFGDTLNELLPTKRKPQNYVKRKLIKPTENGRMTFQKDIPIADNALLDINMHKDDTVENKAIAKIVGTHMGRKAFDKLRTEEQLAYAVGAFDLTLKDYSGIAMFIQAPSLDLKATQERFDEFKKNYLANLDAFTESEFTQLKNSILVSLKETPKNLSEELGVLLPDWYNEKWSFDSEQQLIQAVEKAQFGDFRRYLEETIYNANAPRIRIQLRGTTFRDVPFDVYENETVIKDLSEFNRKMLLQE